MTSFRAKVSQGSIIAVLCFFGPPSATDAVASTQDVNETLEFSNLAPFASESLMALLRLEMRREAIDDERLNKIYWDKKSRRLWIRSDNGFDLGWAQAVNYCANLEFGDYTDWRLPSIEELESLHDPTSRQVYKVQKAITLSACCQWSATKNSSTAAWNFSFRFRKAFSGSLTYSLDLRALCVRGPLESLPPDWPEETK